MDNGNYKELLKKRDTSGKISEESYTYREVPREQNDSEKAPEENISPKKVADMPEDETPKEMEARIRAKVLRELEMEKKNRDE